MSNRKQKSMGTSAVTRKRSIRRAIERQSKLPSESFTARDWSRMAATARRGLDRNRDRIS